MRAVTTAFLEAVRAQESGEVFLLLVTLDHAVLNPPMRAANNTQAVISRGDTFLAYPFEIELPTDSDRPPRARLRIDNVDREIVTTLRQVAGPVSVTAEVVLASDPDTVEAAFEDMSLMEARYDALVVEGELAYEDVLNEPFPGIDFTPANFPGLFP